MDCYDIEKYGTVDKQTEHWSGTWKIDHSTSFINYDFLIKYLLNIAMLRLSKKNSKF